MAFNATDNATPQLEITFECQLDFDPWAPCESPESMEGLEVGPHTFRIRAIDLALNADPTPAEVTFTVVPPPVTTLTSKPPLFSNSETATFAFEANQLGSTFECSYNGSEWAPCVSPAVFFTVEDGTHEFQVRAINPELVVEDPPIVYEWEVELGPDVTPPNTRILTGPPEVTQERIAEFEFEGTDNRPGNLTFQCSLDGAQYVPCDSGIEYIDLTRQVHTFDVKARDAWGNWDPTPDSWVWEVKAPPVTTILSGPAPDEITESRSATFTFASSTPGSTYWCWLDGDARHQLRGARGGRPGRVQEDVHRAPRPRRARVRRPRAGPGRDLGAPVGRVRVGDRLRQPADHDDHGPAPTSRARTRRPRSSSR